MKSLKLKTTDDDCNEISQLDTVAQWKYENNKPISKYIVSNPEQRIIPGR